MGTEGESRTGRAEARAAGSRDNYAEAFARLRRLVSERRDHARGEGSADCVHSALAIISEALATPLAKFLELAASGDVLVFRAGVGFSEAMNGSIVPVQAASPAAYVLRHRGAVIFDDIQSTSRFTAAAILREHGATAALSVRVDDASGVRGVLSVHAQSERRFTAAEATFLENAAMMFAELV